MLGDIIGLDGTAVCGSSLLSTSRAVTAAHCWFDGTNQIWRFTIVLGSTTLFSGGTRIQSSVVAMHPNWSPSLVRNDVAIIYLPSPVPLSSKFFSLFKTITFEVAVNNIPCFKIISDVIAPVALPSGSELAEDFVGSSAIAAGFGVTSGKSAFV